MKYLELVLTTMILFSIISCKTKAPIVVKEKEYIIITNYCQVTDFIFNANDMLDFDGLSLNNFSVDEIDSSIAQIILNKNVLYSPDKQYYIEFKFVPAQNDFLIGTCNAEIYTADTVLISIIKNVYQNEKVLWLKDFIIFEGYGNEFTRKIIVDLKTGYSKELAMMGHFVLLGKSSSAAFYESMVAGATIGPTKLTTKYSVVRVSKDIVTQVHETNNSLFPFFYNENVSIFYNAIADSFNLYLDNKFEYSFQASTNSFPFDQLRNDSITYVLIKNVLYKISNNCRRLAAIYPRTKSKIDAITEFRVLGNKVLFISRPEISNKDVSPDGLYTTKNNVTFNVREARYLSQTKTFSGFVSEFGIFDLSDNSIHYPQIMIVN
jgi:hypothetical protein